MGDVPVLVCTAGQLVGRRIRVPEGGIGIGRSSENTVVIHDDGVSRYHARLLFDNGSLWLQDAGSRNGIFINGVRLTGHKALKVGDAITIAQHTFELRWENDLESATTNEPTPPGSEGAGPPSDEGSRPPSSGVVGAEDPRPGSEDPTASAEGASPHDRSSDDRGGESSTDDTNANMAGQGDGPNKRRWYWPF